VSADVFAEGRTYFKVFTTSAILLSSKQELQKFDKGCGVECYQLRLGRATENICEVRRNQCVAIGF
jgi:hypothetical protein